MNERMSTGDSHTEQTEKYKYIKCYRNDTDVETSVLLF